MKSISARKSSLTKFINSEFIRFAIVGGINTVLGYLLYRLLLLGMEYQLAYTLSYVSGIFISYYLNSRFAFREPLQLKKALSFPLVYVVQYLLGILFLTLLVDVLAFDQRIAPILVIVLSLPFTFLLSRFIIKTR